MKFCAYIHLSLLPMKKWASNILDILLPCVVEKEKPLMGISGNMYKIVIFRF